MCMCEAVNPKTMMILLLHKELSGNTVPRTRSNEKAPETDEEQRAAAKAHENMDHPSEKSLVRKTKETSKWPGSANPRFGTRPPLNLVCWRTGSTVQLIPNLWPNLTFNSGSTTQFFERILSRGARGGQEKYEGHSSRVSAARWTNRARGD